MLSKFFIDRPIFAGVIAIVIMAFGIFALINLPVERYPDIAPPRITISANYSGADAQTVEQSVTQILEQQIQGIDHLLYFSSSSDSTGRSRISISFKNGTNPDTAQVQVQNSISSVIRRLPDEVQRQGVNVSKSLGDTFMVIGLYDRSGKTSSFALADYLATHIQDELGRLEGVGELDTFGSQYAMRIWLDPFKLKQYSLMPSDIGQAIEAQNTQVAAGGVGDLPVNKDQYLNAKVTAGSKLKTVADFENVIVKGNKAGSFVYLKDVARIELGAENYQFLTTINGYQAAGLSISLSSGANAIQTSKLIKQALAQISEQLPEGYTIVYPRDNTPFVQESIKEVVKTLFEAIILVIIVMFIFLQSWRATLIPAITVPVVILGTFAVLYMIGMSINTLTLFALVLAIGLLVDDAIVVVENVERLMHEQHMTAREASIESMQEISGALVGITLVLTAVFIPMAFFGGSTGVIYRQFSVSLVAAMSLSLLIALILTPALCALILKPTEKSESAKWAVWFNQKIDGLKHSYLNFSKKTLANKTVIWVLFFGLISVFALLYKTLPSSFIPKEDQGVLSVQFSIVDGAPMWKTQETGEQIRQYFLDKEKDNVDIVLIRYGRNFSGSGQNLGQGYIALKSWDERLGQDNSAEAIQKRAMKHFRNNPNAKINITLPSSVTGLGTTDGLDFWIRDLNGQGQKALEQVYKEMQDTSSQFSTFSNLDKQSTDSKANLNVKIDPRQVIANGLNIDDVNSTLSSAWGSTYINDFIDRGRVKRVIMQGDTTFRASPENLQLWSVRNDQNQMVPFSSFSQIDWTGAPDILKRYQGYSALQLQANVAGGASSGAAMQDLNQLVEQFKGVDLEWTGLSYEEKQSSSQAIILYLVSIGFVFLCLAALYESWSIPSVVIAAIPLGIGGNIVLAKLFGLPNDIYFQIALLTTIGLSCKNAILIVEFAALAQQKGKTAVAAALEGAGLRLRPILMTSIAFGAGVIPLVLAFGAGAVSRREIGVSVLGGVIFGTILVLIFIPFMYVFIRTLFKKKTVS
nr:multidrug efflux RND transporter permease subunit [Acinetobacter sp. Marseille-Q1620]